MTTSLNMEFVNSWTLMSTPMTPTFILALYLMIVLKIGPSYMKDKKPYQLRHLLIVYNILQVLFSFYLMYMIAAGMHCYLIAKVSELLDTVFFVLRKKDRQISFLHVYHHILMVIVSWTALKYEPSIHLLFLVVANSFIHVIMYSYYGLSSIPHLTKYLWWKKYITKLQLVQFVTVMTQFVVAAFTSDCRPSYVLTMSLMSNGFIFIYLFSNFYFKNYINNNSNVKKDDVINSVYASNQDASINKNGLIENGFFNKTHKDLYAAKLAKGL